MPHSRSQLLAKAAIAPRASESLSHSSSTSPLTSCDRPMPPSVIVPVAGNFSLPLSLPSAKAWRTAFSISRCALTPSILRNLRMLPLKMSSFMIASFADHREPKSETIWCLCHLFPLMQQTEIGGLWRAARQAHRKHRTFAQLARHGHVAAHHARELAGDGEAETGAAEALSGRGVSLAELLEQLCLLLRRHANAGIDHRQLDPIASIGHLARLQLDLTLFGELAGIVQQVEQYLPQPHGVHGEDTQVLLGVDNETVLVLLGKLSGGANDLVDQRC